MRTVITVSRQVGTDGDLVAKRVADNLGYQYLDKRLMAEQAQKLGINMYEAEACDISEDDYRIRGFVESIFSDRKLITIVESQVGPSLTQTMRTLDEDTCIRVEGTIIKELAKRGRILIVCRGGQALLKGRAEVLCVMMTAPHDFRVRKLMEDKKIGEAEANRLIKDRDAATEQYLRRFYHIEWNDSSNYDITINMEKVPVAVAVSCIVNLARSN